MAFKSLPKYWYLIGTCRCPLGSSMKSFSKTSCHPSLMLNQGNVSDYIMRRYLRTSNFLTQQSISSTAASEELVAQENTFAFNVLRQNKEFSETLSNTFKSPNIPSDINLDDVAQTTWSSKLFELIQQFERISYHRKPTDCFFSHEVFTPLTEALISNVNKMNDEEMLRILRSLAKWPLEPATESGNFFNLWKAIDEECVQRLRMWSRDKILFVILHWYFLGLMRRSRLVYLGVKKVGRKPLSLSPAELTQFMFFVNVARCFHPVVNMLDVEWALYKSFDKFSIHDLGIVSLGFFKSETPIRELKLLNAIIMSLANNIDVAHPYTVAGILKTVRHSIRLWSVDYVAELLEKLAKHVDKYPIVLCCHICSLITKTAVRNDELIKILAQKLKNEIKTARIKDISTIVSCLTTCNYECSENPNIYEITLSEFRHPDRQNEIMKYPKVLSLYLTKLMIVKLYPEDLLSKAFSTEFLVHTYGERLNRFTLPAHLLQLHYATKIEALSYKGPLFDPELVRAMSDHYGWFLPRATSKRKTDLMIFDVSCMIAKFLGGEDYSKLMYTFPSSLKPDIVFCLDEKTNKPLPVPEDVKAVSFLQATLPSTSGKWHCVFATGEHSMLHKTKEPIGYLKHRLRLLSKIGYEPHFFDININVWLDLSDQEKESQVKRIINFSQIGRSFSEKSVAK